MSDVKKAALAAAKVAHKTHSKTQAVAAFCEALFDGTLSAGPKGILLNGTPTGVRAITGYEEAHRILHAAAVMVVNAVNAEDVDKAMAAAAISDAAATIIFPNVGLKSHILSVAKANRLEGYSLMELCRSFPMLQTLI